MRGALTDPSMAATAKSVTVASVDDNGALKVVASGDISANGTFTINDVPAADGPFVVRVVGAADRTLATAIVPEAIASGDVVRTAKVGAETTAEVDVMQALLQGNHAVADVDTIGLMVWLTPDLISASTTADMTAAIDIGQATWIATAKAEGETTTMAKLEGAKLDVWAMYTASLDAAASESDRDEARAELDAAIATAVSGELDLDAGTQSDAEAAAGLVFSNTFAANADAHLQAVKVAATLGAHASWAVQRDAVVGSSVQNEVSAKLESGYEAFITATADATSEADIDAAALALSAAITGRGATDGATSALAVLVMAESTGDDFAAQASVDTALDATAEDSLALQSSIDTALAGSVTARADAVANAYAAFRSDVDDSVATSLGTSISTRVNTFTTEAAAQSGGHLAVLLDLGVQLFDFGPGVTLSGIVQVGLGVTDGASALDGLNTTFDATAGTTVATLSSMDATTGIITEVAQGTVDASNHRFVFQQVTEANGHFIVELEDAQGNIQGALQFDDTSASGHLRDVGTLSHESTVETQVMLARLARLELPATIDRTSIDAYIDAAVAGSLVDTDNVSDAVDISVLASASRAADMAAVGQSDMDMARAQSALAFDAVVQELRGDSLLATSVDARAGIEGAMALRDATVSAFAGTSFASRTTAINTAVEVYLTNVHQADTQSEVDDATQGLADDLIGFAPLDGDADGVLGQMVATDLALGASQQLVVKNATSSSLTAGRTLETSVASAATTANSTAIFDGVSFGTGFTAANTAFGTALATSLDFSSLTLAAGDASALEVLVTHLALSFSGTAALN